MQPVRLVQVIASRFLNSRYAVLGQDTCPVVEQMVLRRVQTFNESKPGLGGSGLMLSAVTLGQCKNRVSTRCVAPEAANDGIGLLRPI